MKIRTLAALMVIVIGVAMVAAAEMYTDSFDQSYAVSADATVSLENVNGDATIEVWDRDEVRVQAEKRAGSQEKLDELEIKVKARPGSVEIDTEYPRHSRGKLEVEYTITVPRTATVEEVELVNGSILIVGVEGGTAVECVNGEIVARELAGEVELSTVNGGIELYASGAEHEVSLESVNGSIDLHLAPSTSADIEAETVNGKIRNDIGIEVKKGRYVGSSMRGSFGGGAASIEIETVNGGITVHGS